VVQSFAVLKSGKKCGKVVAHPPLCKLLAVSNRRQFVAAVIAFSFLLASFRFFSLVNRYAVNVFTWDQWGFNDATIFQQHSLWQIFRWQWGPHRLGVGGVLCKMFEPFLSWNSRYEAFAVASIVSVSALLALILKKRLFGSLSVSDAIIPLILLTPVQYEVLIASGTPSHGPLPMFLMILFGIEL
jgi:hypothetical protein